MYRLTVAAFLLALADFAGAQTYPNKAINLVVPFSTGGIFATKEQASPAGLQALVKSEVEKWVPLLRNAGIKPE